MYDTYVVLPESPDAWKQEFIGSIENYGFPRTAALGGFRMYFVTKLKNHYSFKKRYLISNMGWCPTINVFQLLQYMLLYRLLTLDFFDTPPYLRIFQVDVSFSIKQLIQQKNMVKSPQLLMFLTVYSSWLLKFFSDTIQKRSILTKIKIYKSCHGWLLWYVEVEDSLQKNWHEKEKFDVLRHVMHNTT